MPKPKPHAYVHKYPLEKFTATKPEFAQRDLRCCGVKEIHGIQNKWMFMEGLRYTYELVTPEEFVLQVQEYQRANGRFRPYYLFTEATADGKHPRGDAIVEYIETNKLGSVAIHGPLKNENSGNKVTLFVWMINNEAVQKHKVEWPKLDKEIKAA